MCIGDRWYGDGGIRLSAPLSPAVHLGASRILAMSTGYQRTIDEASTPVVDVYPLAAQIIVQLFKAGLLGTLNEDPGRQQRQTEILWKIDEGQRGGPRDLDRAKLLAMSDGGRSFSNRRGRHVRG